MNPAPPRPEPNFTKDLKTFESLPVKTKELVKLADQSEKTIGPARVALTEMIREKSK